jgi:hypothetical protein
MAALTRLTVIKKFTYNGQPELWSNEYAFDGAVPANATEWRALFDALVAQEKTVYPSYVTVVGGYGHDSDADNAAAVWSVDLTASPNTPVAGTLSTSGSTAAPGDCAVWVRWRTSRYNSRGKPVYLRKYFHGARCEGTSGNDITAATQVTALNNLGGKLRDGTFLDSRRIRSRHHTETLVGASSSAYITTRTLKRRGKRPAS